MNNFYASVWWLAFGLLGLLTVPAQAQTPTFLWAKPYVRSSQGQGAVVGAKVAVDAAGNTYLVGSFHSTASFGPLSLTSTGSSDVFVAKLDPAGNYLWAVAAGGTNEEQGVGIAVDSQQNVYVTGSFRSSDARFGTTPLRSNGTKDLFVAKLDATGQWVWASRGGGEDNEDVGQALATDGTSVFLTGYLSSATAQVGPTTLTNAAVGPFVVAAKLSSSTGAWQWAVGSSGPGAGQASGGLGNGIVADGQGGAYLVGMYGIWATFGSTVLRAGDHQEIFVAKLTAAGRWGWAVAAGGTDSDYGMAIAADAQGGLYITGSSASRTLRLGTLTLSNMNSSNNVMAYVAKLTPTGAFVWATRAGGVGLGYVTGTAIAVDPAGDAYVAGGFGLAPVPFGPFSLTTAGETDAFVAKLTGLNGTWQWALRGGSPYTDYCNGIGVDPQGNVSIAGYFTSPLVPALFGQHAVVGNNTTTTGFVARVGLLPTTRIRGDSLLCGGGQLQLQASTSEPATAYAWSTGATSAQITVTQPGLYTLTTTFPGGRTTSTSYRVTSLVPVVQISGDTLLCAGTTSALVATATTGASLLWNTGATTPTLAITQPGRYTVTARYGTGCSTSAQLMVRAPQVQITGAATVCPGSSVLLTAAAPGAVAYRWNTGATTAAVMISSPGTYQVTATYANGCTALASQQVSAPAVVIRGDSLLCAGTGVDLSAQTPGATGYAWSTGAQTATIRVTQPGLYSVTARFPTGCTATSQWWVRPASPLSPFTLGADTTVCEGEVLVLQAPTQPGVSYRWSDGSTGSTLTVQQAGVYSLQVQGACQQLTSSRQVAFRSCVVIPNIITPNQDQQNDYFVVQGVPPGKWSLQIFNRWGTQVYSSAAYQNDWGATVSPGIYYYLLVEPGTKRHYRGWVEVIR